MSHKIRLIFIAFLLILIVLSANTVGAQTVVLKGRITDANTGEPMPFSNIYLKTSKKGTTSDVDGYYTFTYTKSTDSLIFSAIGYRHQAFYLPNLKVSELNIKLVSQDVMLGEIEVKPKKTRAYMILKKVHEFEKMNNPEFFVGVKGEEYNRTTIMFTNIDSKYKNTKAFKSVQEGFIDFSDSVSAIPVLISEEINRFIIPANGSRKVSQRLNEYTKSFDMFDGVDITSVTNEMTQSQNYYNNYITMVGRSFVSPLGLSSRFFYKMWISDSILSDTNKLIQITYIPRRSKDLCFKGYFWIEDTTYAITEIKADLNETANINHVQDYRAHNVYEKKSDGKWYYKTKRTDLIFDYTPGNDTTKKLSTYVSKVTSFRNIENTDENEFTDVPEIMTRREQEAKAKTDRDSAFWNQQRYVKLDTTEQLISKSIDTLKTNSFVQLFDKAVTTGLTGYWEMGKFDFGPYSDVYRYNELEGHRFTFTGRTSRNFNPYYSIGGYLGYGTLSKDFKYGMSLRFKLNWKTYSVLGLDAWNDVRKIGSNDNLNLIRENSYGSSEDNILSALTASAPNDKISEKQFGALWLEHDLKQGITTKFKAFGSVTHQGPFVPFTHNGEPVNAIDQIAGSVSLRLAFKETYISQYFMRIYMGQKRPIINMNAEAGFTRSSVHNEPYLRLHLTWWHRTPVGMGSLLYIVEAGKYFGTLPFSHLEIHRGNQTFAYARYSFNMLNYMEYVSDTYLNVYSAYDFGGLVMNKLPLLKHLNFRELISFKGLMGTLSDKNTEILELPAGTTAVPVPYGEVGIGFTNVLKYGRIEYVWRLSDRNKPDIVKQGIRFRFEFNF